MIVNLVRERNNPHEKETWIDTFEYDGFHGTPEEALRAAVNEFLATKEGKKAIDYSGHDFNWGDAVTSVPDAIWEKHGLWMMGREAADVVVNQDEVLCNKAGLEGRMEEEEE